MKEAVRKGGLFFGNCILFGFPRITPIVKKLSIMLMSIIAQMLINRADDAPDWTPPSGRRLSNALVRAGGLQSGALRSGATSGAAGGSIAYPGLQPLGRARAVAGRALGCTASRHQGLLALVDHENCHLWYSENARKGLF
jgi:hypothetical protein